MQHKLTLSFRLVPAAALLLAACSGDLPTTPAEAPSLARHQSAAPADFIAAPCPTRIEYTASAVIGADGGKVEIAGHNLTIPAGAVGVPTTFTLRAPAGRYLQIELTAQGAEHYEFPAPASVT